MRVLFISRGYPPFRGGTENYAREIYERLKPVNENKLITIRHPERQPRDDIIDVKAGKNKYLAFLKFWVSCIRKIRRSDADVIHAITYPAGLCGILPKLFNGIPLVTTLHDIGVIEKGIIEVSKLAKLWKGFLQQVVCNFSDAIIVPSEKVKNDIIKYHGTKPGKIFVTDYGIDREVFNENLEYGKIRKKLGIGKGPMLLFIGMFGPKKGLEYAIEAVSTLRQKFPDIKFVIGGPALDESYMEKLKQKVESLGLEKNVVFSGFIEQPELPYWFRDCDIYVDPTLYGMGYCFPCVEAAATGRPIVATKLLEDIGVVKDGFNGTIIGYRDASQISSAVESLLSDPGKMEKFSENSLKLAEKFDWNRTVEQTGSVYRAVTDHTP
ncbi:MAG: glycosyltransferase family 4 protein [Candidatus Aenigmarchaeota archaeon]|nr:glycosyltransferase family 4 protein [Candidatus Aenigmarchaeota archaeon]